MSSSLAPNKIMSLSVAFPSMTGTQRDRHQHAGETCTSYNASAAFTTTPQNLLFCEALLDSCRMVAGDRPGIFELSAARGPIRLLRRFNGESRRQRGRVFVAEEKKSEMRR